MRYSVRTDLLGSTREGACVSMTGLLSSTTNSFLFLGVLLLHSNVWCVPNVSASRQDKAQSPGVHFSHGSIFCGHDKESSASTELLVGQRANPGRMVKSCKTSNYFQYS